MDDKIGRGYSTRHRFDDSGIVPCWGGRNNVVCVSGFPSTMPGRTSGPLLPVKSARPPGDMSLVDRFTLMTKIEGLQQRIAELELSLASKNAMIVRVVEAMKKAAEAQDEAFLALMKS